MTQVCGTLHGIGVRVGIVGKRMVMVGVGDGVGVPVGGQGVAESIREAVGCRVRVKTSGWVVVANWGMVLVRVMVGGRVAVVRRKFPSIRESITTPKTRVIETRAVMIPKRA